MCTYCLLPVAPQPEGVPLLFRKELQKYHCKWCGQQRHSSNKHQSSQRVSVGQLAMTFAMYVISIPDLLVLDKLYPQQVMLERGLIKEYTSA